MRVACVAPGESLTQATCDQLRGRCHVLAVNNAFQFCPWADWLYASDGPWWDAYGDQVPTPLLLRSWTQDAAAARDWGINHVIVRRDAAGDHTGFPGLSTEPAVIHSGGNGGYAAVNLALQFGATEILLVGYDLQGSHFFGEYPQPRLKRSADNRARSFRQWRERFATIRPADYGLAIFNCTPGSALHAFPFRSLDDALSGLPQAPRSHEARAA